MTVGFVTMQSKSSISEPPQASPAERRVRGYQTPLRMKKKLRSFCSVFCICVLTLALSGCFNIFH
jgi:hypothetical protein